MTDTPDKKPEHVSLTAKNVTLKLPSLKPTQPKPDPKAR